LSEIKYKRILLKVSGEALGEKTARGDGFGLDFAKIHGVCQSIKECIDMGVQVGLVIGGGNFWRGVKNGSGKLQRSHADAMGMLATVMNAIAVADVLEQHGLDARVLTAVEMNKFAEYFTRDTANRYLNEGKVVIFAAGTGNPYFSTDTGAVLRAAEINADAILLAKNIDGVYNADPAKDPTAVKFDKITYDEVLARGLAVMDTAATALAKENNIPVIVFAVKDPDNITKVLCGEKIGSYVGVK
jgi:uridylate kinase